MTDMKLHPQHGWIPKYGYSPQAAKPIANVQNSLHGPEMQIDGFTTTEEIARFFLSGVSTNSGERVTPHVAKNVSCFFRCLELVTGVFGHLPFQLKRRDGDIVHTEHEHKTHLLLNRSPNRIQVPSEFKKLLYQDMLLQGNGYAHIVRSVDKVVELNRVTNITPVLLKSGDLVYRYIGENGKDIVIPQEDILHFRGPTFDGYTGTSVLSSAAQTIGLALAAEKHTSATFKNGAAPGAALESPEKLNAEAQDNLRKSVEAYRGAANAGKTLILESGMTFKPMTMNMVDAEIIKSRQLTNEDICRFFGVPPHLAGDVTKSTSFGKGIAEQTLSFMKFTMQPTLTMFEEVLNKALLGDEGDLFFKCNTNAFLQSDLVSRTEAYIQQLQYGIYSPNEIRAFENKNPRPGGDRYYEPPNTAGGQKNENEGK